MTCIYCNVTLTPINTYGDGCWIEGFGLSRYHHCNGKACVDDCDDDKKPNYHKQKLKKPQSLKNELNYKETK